MSRGEEIFSLSSVSLGNGGVFDRRLRDSRTGKPFLSFPFRLCSDDGGGGGRERGLSSSSSSHPASSSSSTFVVRTADGDKEREKAD